MYDCDVLKQKIEKGLVGSTAEITNMRRDDEHFVASVTFQGFEGKSLIEQHRMVYDCLRDEFEEGMHSLSLKTRIE